MGIPIKISNLPVDWMEELALMLRTKNSPHPHEPSEELKNWLNGVEYEIVRKS